MSRYQTPVGLDAGDAAGLTMGRTRGPDYDTRPCLTCGADQDIEIDTDGNGRLVEKPLPCEACEARMGLPKPGPVKGHDIVPIAAHVLRKDPEATANEVYAAIVDLGYKPTMSASSFINNGYFKKGKEQAKRLGTTASPRRVARVGPPAPPPSRSTQPAAVSREATPGRVTFEVTAPPRVPTHYDPPGLGSPVEEGREDAGRPEAEATPRTTPDTSAGSRAGPRVGGARAAASPSREPQAFTFESPAGKLTASELEPGSAYWSIEMEGTVRGEVVGDLLVALIAPLVAEATS